jgi:hypothetical protein
MRCWFGVLALVAGLGGCADRIEDEAPQAAPAPAAAAPAPAPAAAAPAPAPAGAAPRAPRVQALTVARADVDRAEDGRGQLVAAVNARALDVRAESWPGRALDPELHVGGLVFREYSFPEKGVIRFVAADAALLPAGAEVAIQYGHDVSTRAVVTAALEVTQ